MLIPEHVKKSYVAKLLYPHLEQKVATAKLHNKINGIGYAKLTEDEEKKIKEILK